MDLSRGRALADEVVSYLSPACARIQVAGSIRRGRPFVNDIDIVLIPSNQGKLAVLLKALGEPIVGGSKIIRRRYKDIQIDIYLATPRTWATLLLIKTGSAQHNVHLASRAKSMNLHLGADGTGVTDAAGNAVAWETEEQIFAALEMRYKEPALRE